MITAVIDCNVIVMCLTSRSPFHLIYQALVKGEFNIAVSYDILLEYEEIIQYKYGLFTAKTFIALLKELSNVRYTTSYYKWQLIEADPDDNKYSDCAIASGTTYLVTEDKHFSILKHIAFPKITVISINEFVQILEQIQDN